MVAVGTCAALIQSGTELGDLPCYCPIQKPVIMGGATPLRPNRLKRGGRAMTVSRTLLFATFVVAAPFAAYGQFGGMPGMPGAPGGMPGGGGFGAAPQQGPPPACRELLAMRDEVQKHGTAIQKANEKKATV